jgi:hypothetical protein
MACGGESGPGRAVEESDAHSQRSTADAGFLTVGNLADDASVCETDAARDVDIDGLNGDDCVFMTPEQIASDADLESEEWCANFDEAQVFAAVNVRVFLIKREDGGAVGSERLYYHAFGERALNAREAECVDNSCSEWVIKERVCGKIAIVSDGYEPAESPYQARHTFGTTWLEADPRTEQTVVLEVASVLVTEW